MSTATAAAASKLSIGDHLRAWRERRRLSQLALALEAGISTRHLSFLETGRSQPSREMVMLLATHLDIPLRERNVLLVAGGFAPVYSERPFDDPGLEAARRAVTMIVQAHEPFPALALNRHWEMVSHNKAIPAMLAGLPAHLLKPPVNVLRVSLHPEGLAGRIANLRQWRDHLLERLRHQIAVTADPKLVMLLAELQAYPCDDGGQAHTPPSEFGGLVIPLHLTVPGGVVKLMSTTTIFGSPMDVTVSELAIETFFPVDEPSAAFLRSLSS